MSPTGGETERLAEREEMVTYQIERRGVRSPAVLAALRRIPREWFLSETVGSAYSDNALPIDCGQTISQPYIVAKMTELLALRPESRVLEIGTGSGYQTAILASIAKTVYTIEWHHGLMTQAEERLKRLGLTNVCLRCADGSLGWPEQAPFDAIIVTAGAPEVPEPLSTQLVEGGRLVVPIGPLEDQTLVCVRRTATGFEHEPILKCRFVKLLGAAGWQE